MSAVRGTVQDGKVVFDTPPTWPEGTPVTVNPATAERPDDEDSSAEAIAVRLALMDRFQPWMTPEELAAWETTRAEDKAFQLARWEKRCKQIEEQFP